jgi:hypothetical protein
MRELCMVCDAHLSFYSFTQVVLKLDGGEK